MLIEEVIFGLAGLAIYTVLAGLAVVELALSVLGIILEGIIGLFLDRRQPSAGAEAEKEAPGMPVKPKVRRRWPRRLALGAGACLLLTVGMVLALNFLFFDPTARWVFGRVQDRTGIDVRFGSASGNLLTGRLALRDVTLRRTSHPATTFDLRAETFEVNLSVWSMVFGLRRVESARMSGLKGTVRRVGDTPPTPWFARRSILIDQLALDGAEVTWIDETTGEPTPVQWTLAVDELRAEGLYSRWLAFGLLFSTTAKGRVNGRPFHIADRREGAVRTREWRFEELPAAAFGEYVGGPFKWVKRGSVDVRATTTSAANPEGGRLVMDWSVEFRDVRAEPPPHLSGVAARLAAPFIDYVNAHGDHLPLSFMLELERGRFEGAASPEAAGLWRAVRDAAVKELGGRVTPPTGAAEDLKRPAADRLSRFRRGATRPGAAADETAP